MESQVLCKIDKIKKRSILTKDGNPARYHLQTKTDNLDESKTHRKMTFGERDKNKPHKSILMVGETGTGKTTLINVMINYMLGIKREDKVWFEITDDQSDRTQAHSQTSSITVYGFYPQESPIDLTIIDTPGYANTQSINLEKEIAMSLLNLITSAKEDQHIDAVCLVINATQNRFFDRLANIFDTVQFLFGKGISENIVLLCTHSSGAPPKNALTAVKEAKLKCAVNDKNRPVFFLFDNCQSDADDEEYEDEDDEECEQRLEQSWNLSSKGMTKLFKFLDTIQPKPLQMNQDVLKKQKWFCKICNLLPRIKIIELKQNELKQTLKALDQNKQNVKDSKNFEYDVDVPYKERIPINPEAAKAVMCCTFCEENCVYPDGGWIGDLSWCSVMKDDHCTVCTKRCHYSKHVEEAKIYEIKTKKGKRTYEDLKNKYDEKTAHYESVVKKLEEELTELEIEKVKRVFDAFHCVEILEKITHNTNLLQHIDDLIRKLKEINEQEKAEIVEDIKKRAGEEKQNKEHLGT